MAIIKYAKASHQTLSRIITYVCKDEKTTEKLISGKDCLSESALFEMQTAKDMHGKAHGRQYIHLVQAVKDFSDGILREYGLSVLEPIQIAKAIATMLNT